MEPEGIISITLEEETEESVDTSVRNGWSNRSWNQPS